MAKSCLCPGLVALITNLIKSNEERPSLSDNGKDNQNSQWLKDYQKGQQYEIYRHKIPENFEGWQFCSIANEIYKESGLLLFALEIKVDQKKGSSGKQRQGDILLNPGDYRLPKPRNASNKYEYYGYFVAEDEEQVTTLFSEQNQFTRKQSEDYNREMINEIRDRVAECQFIENRQSDDI